MNEQPAAPPRPTATQPVTEPFRWTASHVAAIEPTAANTIPPFAADTHGQRLPDLDVWDMWPVECADGSPPVFAQGRLWIALAAPVLPDPEDRHALARLHWVLEDRLGAWHDGGPAFPDEHTPGSREWSGCALYDPATAQLMCWFTAAGRRDEPQTTFEQRLFWTQGALTWQGNKPAVAAWSTPVEAVAPDDATYLRVVGTAGAAGTIKAFRDPAYVHDPRSGRHLLFFTASKPGSASPWNGLIGMAASDAGPTGPWRLLPPPVCAEGLNNELERPHMRVRGNHYYLFWSTQRKVFAEPGPKGPTGLYGVVGPSPFGPFTPLNGTGLVAANPDDAPWQAYSWWVLNDLSVTSFADLPGVAPGADLDSPALRRQHFAGHPAPWFTLALEGATTRIVPA